ncbi:DUF3891 family protein [Lentibacillus sp. L22]|uniref:DUF3891 family protein n=1 Tax=Lentibacillus TaxID=175304 RepID=UPI0022B21BBF|nr:DUF3891 family protein [Lentibacillus daqui]
MIVREHENEYIMIEQDNHAHISGELAAAWKDTLFAGNDLRKSVEYAVSNHDLGWRPFDKQPFWNDQQHMPYTFIDFPVLAKTVLYKYGIDEVASRDTYASLLCSRHYTRFLVHHESPEAQQFVQQEKDRQQRIMESFAAFDQDNYDYHYALLQFFDNVSLYICLNDPGVAKQDEHRFFKSGIPVSDAFTFFKQDKAWIEWRNDQTIQMECFPFDGQVDLTLKQKVITKETIAKKGLLNSYQDAPYERQEIHLIGR